jgi:hypothetical protein
MLGFIYWIRESKILFFLKYYKFEKEFLRKKKIIKK